MLIGILEDDKLLSQALELALRDEGYETVCAETVKAGTELISRKPDLLLIDLGLPDGDGLEWFRRWRGEDKIPAIFLTARDEEKDMLAAFSEGAEDYVVKPFSIKVLLKRIEVALRRQDKEAVLRCGDLILDLRKKQARRAGEIIALTAKEYRLLEYLMENQGQVLTKETILDRVWGLEGEFVVENTVSVTVNRLRKKIELDGEAPRYIRNVFGLGYCLGE